MTIVTITSSTRAREREEHDYPPCCGQRPRVFDHRPKNRRSYKCSFVECVNPDCPNHGGVLEIVFDNDRPLRDKWEKYRRA